MAKRVKTKDIQVGDIVEGLGCVRAKKRIDPVFCNPPNEQWHIVSDKGEYLVESDYEFDRGRVMRGGV